MFKYRTLLKTQIWSNSGHCWNSVFSLNLMDGPICKGVALARCFMFGKGYVVCWSTSAYSFSFHTCSWFPFVSSILLVHYSWRTAIHGLWDMSSYPKCPLPMPCHWCRRCPASLWSKLQLMQASLRESGWFQGSQVHTKMGPPIPSNNSQQIAFFGVFFLFFPKKFYCALERNSCALERNVALCMM